MNRLVELNMPMFIGIILLITVVTGALVYSINSVRTKVQHENDKMSSEFQSVANIINVEK